MLSIDDVSVRFGAALAVDHVSLQVRQGGITAILGPSGCGKSSLLRAVAGLEPLASGSVVFAGEDLDGVPTHQRGFAMMFQDGQLFAHLDVAGNVRYALARKGIRGAPAVQEVHRLLDMVGLPGYAARRPSTLSGGEAQRVALARALAARPRLLLLDEPLSALDRTLRERLADDLRGALRQTGTTALLVTHDHDEAFAIADRAAVMRAGRLVQEGSTPEVWAHPADPETALFLGFDAVLTGAAADLALERLGVPSPGAQPWVAVRREAVRIAADGRLTGTVVSTRLARDGIQAVVLVDGLGELPAVSDARHEWAPGDQVALRIEADHLAIGSS
jgi:thiamine transport system ATP-binding protein